MVSRQLCVASFLDIESFRERQGERDRDSRADTAPPHTSSPVVCCIDIESLRERFRVIAHIYPNSKKLQKIYWWSTDLYLYCHHMLKERVHHFWDFWHVLSPKLHNKDLEYFLFRAPMLKLRRVLLNNWEKQKERKGEIVHLISPRKK